MNELNQIESQTNFAQDPTSLATEDNRRFWWIKLGSKNNEEKKGCFVRLNIEQ